MVPRLVFDHVQTWAVVPVRAEQPVVLVVEDDPGIRELYEATLGDHFRLRTAQDEDEALAALDDTIAVALVDRDLASGSGDEVLAAIRERDVDCRVAMVTGVVPDTAVVDMGFDDYLTKPVDPEQLRSTVSELLLRSTYDERVREYYALARKRVLLEEEHASATLRGNEEYEALCDRLTAIREAAADVLDELGERDAYQQLGRDGSQSAVSV